MPDPVRFAVRGEAHVARRFDAVMHDVSAPCLAIARAIRFRLKDIGCRSAALHFLAQEVQFRFHQLFRPVSTQRIGAW